MKDWIERRTGLLFGTYRWTAPTPPPRFAVILRSPDDADMMPFEANWGTRGIYVTSARHNAAATGRGPRR